MSSQKGQSNRNWSEYNANLVNRGRLTLFVDQNFADSWYVKYDKTSHDVTAVERGSYTPE